MRLTLIGVHLSPEHAQRIHLVLTILWFLMMPVALFTGWVASVVFISVISIYANFAGHFAAWQAARTEVRQKNGDTAKN